MYSLKKNKQTNQATSSRWGESLPITFPQLWLSFPQTQTVAMSQSCFDHRMPQNSWMCTCACTRAHTSSKEPIKKKTTRRRKPAWRLKITGTELPAARPHTHTRAHLQKCTLILQDFATNLLWSASKLVVQANTSCIQASVAVGRPACAASSVYNINSPTPSCILSHFSWTCCHTSESSERWVPRSGTRNESTCRDCSRGALLNLET